MRKSFTRLSSVLVLLLLSIQMAFAQPVLVSGGLSPSDGATNVVQDPVFTMTFQENVFPGVGQIIAMYSSGGTEYKSIQLTGNTTISPYGEVTFSGKTVTIKFYKDNTTSAEPYPFKQGTTYYITVGTSAIRNAAGQNFVSNVPAAFGVDNMWTFTVGDFTPPTVKASGGFSPAHNQTGINPAVDFVVTFTENVQWASTITVGSNLKLGDIAIYTSTDTQWPEEGGDLINLAPLQVVAATATPANGQVSILGDKLYINWPTNLPSSKKMYVRIKGGIITDLSTNAFAGINNNTTWVVNTKNSTFANPVITAGAAFVGSTNNRVLWTNDNFYIDFNEALYNSSGVALANGANMKSHVSVSVNGTDIGINTATYDAATFTIAIDPQPDMNVSGGTYTVKLNANAVYDADGNVMSQRTANFTAGDYTAPDVLATFPQAVNQSGTTIDLLFKANEPATVRYIVTARSVTGTAEPDTATVIGYNRTGGTSTTTKEYRNTTAVPGKTVYRWRTSSTASWNNVEIFAEGTINIPVGNSATPVLHRISGLPASNGAEYKVYFVLNDASTQGLYNPDYSGIAPAAPILPIAGNISGVKSLSENVYTTDILMPNAYFQGDSIGWKTTPKLVNNLQRDPVTIGASLTGLARDGKLYIVFNEAVRKANGDPIATSDEIKSFLTIEQNTVSFTNYTASISADKKTITITPLVSWASAGTVDLFIKNSLIEDNAGNELVTSTVTPFPTNIHLQRYTVESYLPPLVRYAPATGATNVAKNRAVQVVVSQKIYLPQFRAIELGYGAIAKVPFTNVPSDDTYIGKWFKIRSGNATTVTESSSNALEANFDFFLSYSGDSTIITITPQANYLSETYYLFKIDERIQDINGNTILNGAGFLGAIAWYPAANTGNPTVPVAADNQTMVFKSEDTVAPSLTFFSKKQSTVPTTLVPINGKNNIDIVDTIGVFINEYVSMGYDGFVKYDALSGSYSLDANAMRRYFTVKDAAGNALSFDVVDIDITKIANDTLIFYIDPYSIGNDTTNFVKGGSFEVCYISNVNEVDVTGGSYWDDNKNKIAPVCANFSVVSDPVVPTVTATVYPVNNAIVKSTMDSILITFNHPMNNATQNAIPQLNFVRGANSSLLNGTIVPGTTFKTVKYTIPMVLGQDSTFQAQITTDGAFAFDGTSAVWPPLGGTVGFSWSFKTVDDIAPIIDTLATVAMLVPQDDATGFNKETNMSMTFNEKVKLIAGKKLIIYNSGYNTVATIDASLCTLSSNQLTVTIPSNLYSSLLQYNTDYHIVVQSGFVQDLTGNDFAGILTQDINTGAVDGVNDWAFQTGSNPPPAYASFSPKDATTALTSPLVFTFSENVRPVAGHNIYIHNVSTGAAPIPVPVTSGVIIPNSGLNKTYTIPQSTFTPVWGNIYRVHIPAGAYVDEDSNPIYVCDSALATPSTVGSATGPVSAVWRLQYQDITAPVVSNFWPVNNARHIPYNAYIYAQFSETLRIHDGTAIIPDANAVAQNIKNFISITKDGVAYGTNFNVELIDNDKRIVRITMRDPQGYNYSAASNNPTMDTSSVYTVTIAPTWGGYTLTDSVGLPNSLVAGPLGLATTFTVEDIQPPVLTLNSVTAPTSPANNVTINYTVTGEALPNYSGSARVFAAIVASNNNSATAANLFAQNVPNVVAYFPIDTAANGVARTKTIAIPGNPLNAAQYKVVLVAEDMEKDVWINPAAWDTLFMKNVPGETFDRIRDIMPAPNKMTAIRTSSNFAVCDNDAPVVNRVRTTPANGTLNFPVANNVVVKFSEPIQQGTVTPNTVKLRRYDNNIEVASALTWNTADSSVTINPNVNLDQETKYYVEIDRYAVRDMSTCDPDSNYASEWVGKDSLWFQTVDNLAPRFGGVSPANLAACVDPTTNKLVVTFYERSDLKKRVGSDPYVYLYRARESVTTAWEVIPFSNSKVSFSRHATNDTIQYLNIDLGHGFMNDDSIKVIIPGGQVADAVNNFYAADVVWSFTTTDNVAPVASWTVYDYAAFFNYSSSDNPANSGIFAKWAPWKNGAEGDVVANVPNDIIIKVKFDENVEIRTATNTYVPLTAYNAGLADNNSNTDNQLSRKEIIDAITIKKGGTNLTWNATEANSQIKIYSVGADSIVFGIKNETNKLLSEATLHGTSNPMYTYYGSTTPNSQYSVVIAGNKVYDPYLPCSLRTTNAQPVTVVTLNTRDDEKIVLTSSVDAASACVGKQDTISLAFSKPVVKSSKDIMWLQHESLTADNLPLNNANIQDTTGTKYFELREVVRTGTSPNWVYTPTGNKIPVIASVQSDMKTIKIVPAGDLKSDTWYRMVFEKYSVKEYIENDPTGLLFEGDTTYFKTYDFVAPTVVAGTYDPAVGATNISADRSFIALTFFENIQRGAGTMHIRRENGSIFQQIDALSSQIVIDATGGLANKKVTINFKDPQTGATIKLDDFTTYYVEMPAGFFKDNNGACKYNDFAGFKAQLDLTTGKLISADWSFTTSDKEPPTHIFKDANGQMVTHLVPVVGAVNVPKNSDLVITLSENIQVTTNPNAGIVIYHDNGQSGHFGNAVEFIPWGDARITIGGSDIYNNRDKDRITVNPNTVFDRLGTYYIRINGADVKDFAAPTTNAWAGIKDREWYFTITNDVAPELVSTTPQYVTYNPAGAPVIVPTLAVLPADTLGFVKADLSMTFKDKLDSTGVALKVVAGGANRFIRIFEYIYTPSTGAVEEKLWKQISITDPSVEFNNNVVTVKNVILRDGINGNRFYYVTVDGGAILNGFEGSQTFWDGISNSFRWRFQTASDTKFSAGYDILSKNVAEHGEAAKNLTITEAKKLEVEFTEGIEALLAPAGKVKIYYDSVGERKVADEITVVQSMVNGKKLTVESDKLKDETTYYVHVEAGAFGDTATVSNNNFEILMGADNKPVWVFHTGDNTAPVADASKYTPAHNSECNLATPTLRMQFKETYGVKLGAGKVLVVNAAGVAVDSIDVEGFSVDATNPNIVMAKAPVKALADTTWYTVKVPAGFVIDNGNNNIPNVAFEWMFKTGENTKPTLVSFAPADTVGAATVNVVLTFSEKVEAVNGKFVTISNGTDSRQVAASAFTVDALNDKVFNYTAENLISETTYTVTIAEGAFKDVNAGCVANTIDQTVRSFIVGDILAPTATYLPNTTVEDYVGLTLKINFNDNVKAVAGKNVVIYPAGSTVAKATVPATSFVASSDNKEFTYLTTNLGYGHFYVLIDQGAFVDQSAKPIGQAFAGVSDSTVWKFAVIDNKFDCAEPNPLTPYRGEQNVQTTTTISAVFCSERIKAGTGFVTIGDQSPNQVEGVNFWKFGPSDFIIEGSKLTINVTGLKENTTYSIIIAPGAIVDEAGNLFAGIIDANKWWFTTGDFTKPVVTVGSESVNNVNGKVNVSSNELGKVYIASGTYTTEAAIKAAIAQGKAKEANVVAANQAVEFSTAGLVAGTYKAYAVDAAGNLGESTNTFEVVDVPMLTIKQIQGEVNASPQVGKLVATKGMVTAVTADGKGYFIQDANATWSGVYVNDAALKGIVQVNTPVKVVGTVAEVNGLTTITDLIVVEYVAPMVQISPIVLTDANEVNTEKYEGVLVTVKGVRATELPNANKDWKAKTTEAISVTVAGNLYAYTPVVGDFYNVTGVVNNAATAYAITPRVAADVVALKPLNKDDLATSIKVYPNPFDKYITLSVSNNVVITKAVITNIAGQLIKEVINPDNTIPTSELRSGVYFISLHTEDGIAKTERIIKR